MLWTASAVPLVTTEPIPGAGEVIAEQSITLEAGDTVTLESLGVTTQGASGDTTVSWFNNGSTLLRDFGNNPLSQGIAATNQDGMLVQLGYFTGGTTGINFAGTFVPLTLGTRIGDSSDLSGEGAGRVGFQTFFTSGTNAVSVYDSLLDAGAYSTVSAVSISGSTPPANQVLAIRFFDTTTGTTGLFNTVSSDTWLWQSPTQLGSTVTLDFGNSALEWQDAVHPFQTYIPVPEPSTALLLMVGLSWRYFLLRKRVALESISERVEIRV